VSNYLLIKINNKLTTPHELAYHAKPDLVRNIFPLFSFAYITQIDVHSYNNQTIRTILVGRSEKSNVLQFYHPQTKKPLSSTRCTIDEALVAGPAFGLQYEGGLYKEKHKDLVVKELARKLYKSPYSNEVSTTCSPCCNFLFYLIRDERMI